MAELPLLNKSEQQLQASVSTCMFKRANNAKAQHEQQLKKKQWLTHLFQRKHMLAWWVGIGKTKLENGVKILQEKESCC